MKPRKTILAVDDIIPCLTMTKQMLEDHYEVYLAKSIDSAMVILKIAKIDLILLDMEMPGMSGLEFIDFLRNTPKHNEIPVIFISSCAARDIFLKAMDAGAKDFLVKPVSPESLREKIETLFRKKPEGEFKAEMSRDRLSGGLMPLTGS
jgi:putative two-component system response regulator